MRLCLLILLLLAAACTAEPDATVELPTLAVLTSLTPSDTPTATFTPSATAATTATRTPSRTPSQTWTPSPTYTVTPSATITDTPSPTPSRTPSPTALLPGLADLALTALAVTLPPTLAATVPPSPTFFITPPGGAVSPIGTPPLVTTPLTAVATLNCPSPVPSTLATFIASDPALSSGLGCPVGLTTFITGAAQGFQGGVMYYVSGPPSTIYVLTPDGRFRRFADTWVEGVDPASGGEVPPPGLLEPIRGFGKVWRTNTDVRAQLGWAVTGEQGGRVSLQSFERGRAIYLPERGETVLLVDNPDGQSGTWRALSGGF